MAVTVNFLPTATTTTPPVAIEEPSAASIRLSPAEAEIGGAALAALVDFTTTITTTTMMVSPNPLAVVETRQTLGIGKSHQREVLVDRYG